MSNNENYYKVLRVDVLAEDYIIRAAYRILASNFHPDKNPDRIRSSNREMQLINEAYSILSDPEKRMAYDQNISVTPQVAPRSEPSSWRVDQNDLGRKAGRNAIRSLLEGLGEKENGSGFTSQ
jgi:DnaJ-class molecular chaperone